MENMYNVSKGQLLQVEVPNDSRTYRAVSHGQLIDLTLEAIDRAGFTVDREVYTSAREGKVANGRFTIKNVADNEMKLEIGFQNSYDKSLSAKYAIGTKIIVCSNGCVNGDFGAFKKKHKGDIQNFVPSAITEYVKRAETVFKTMQEEREKMKQVEVDKTVTAHILGELFFNEEIVTTTQLNIIKRELQIPTYDYGASSSLWELFNFATYSTKEIHPSLYMDVHMGLHRFFTNKSGIITQERSLNIPLDISPNQQSINFEEIAEQIINP